MDRCGCFFIGFTMSCPACVTDTHRAGSSHSPKLRPFFNPFNLPTAYHAKGLEYRAIPAESQPCIQDAEDRTAEYPFVFPAQQKPTRLHIVFSPIRLFIVRRKLLLRSWDFCFCLPLYDTLLRKQHPPNISDNCLPRQLGPRSPGG